VDLSPGRKKAAFAGIVIVLAALGYYLVVPAVTHSRGASRAASPPSQSATTPTAPAAPSATAEATAEGASPGTVNIYAWLPFTQQDLAEAASVTLRFSVDYDTYAYTESAASYVGKMSGLITGELATTLQSGYSTPGVATLRTGQRQVSTGTAVIDSLRAFGPSSLTFIVTAGQRLVSASGTTSGSTQYAVTVTGSGTAWQVSDIELESAGDA
jgi:hypothetical protein